MPITTIFELFALHPGHSKRPPGELELSPEGVCSFFPNFPLLIPMQIVLDCIGETTLAEILPPVHGFCFGQTRRPPTLPPIARRRRLRAVALSQPHLPLAPLTLLPPHCHSRHSVQSQHTSVDAHPPPWPNSTPSHAVAHRPESMPFAQSLNYDAFNHRPPWRRSPPIATAAIASNPSTPPSTPSRRLGRTRRPPTPLPIARSYPPPCPPLRPSIRSKYRNHCLHPLF